MSALHTSIPPERCGSCVKILSILTQHHREHPGRPLTGAAIATAAGIARPTAVFHLSYLAECGRLEKDRRTPAKVEVASSQWAARSPLDWAVSATLPCRTCARLLLVLATLAKGQWSVQARAEDIAAALGASERTAREHLAALTGQRPHARPQTGPLLRAETIPGTAGYGGRLITFLSRPVCEGS
ncbi:hypothetical protein AB0N09_36115 [Streptomyces erythrochromogenes]|uniref:hypothetical protein n=1 Tax=Streptomyces erythrochromogenes TaxID=285574 RepID=UPI00343CAAF8